MLQQALEEKVAVLKQRVAALELQLQAQPKGEVNVHTLINDVLNKIDTCVKNNDLATASTFAELIQKLTVLL